MIFFISYNKQDRSWAEWLAWHLEEAGYTTVVQAWDFRPGSNFVMSMQQASVQARRTVAVLSPDYLASQFVQPEWAAAFAQIRQVRRDFWFPCAYAPATWKGCSRRLCMLT